ncbi:MAG: hypothetical protein JWP15_3089, partial [Alphaproteobacteria bacterium]|nr:hypothetical protein [Alphaproteobacteria bacterium]
ATGTRMRPPYWWQEAGGSGGQSATMRSSAEATGGD